MGVEISLRLLQSYCIFRSGFPKLGSRKGTAKSNWLQSLLLPKAAGLLTTPLAVAQTWSSFQGCLTLQLLFHHAPATPLLPAPVPCWVFLCPIKNMGPASLNLFWHASVYPFLTSASKMDWLPAKWVGIQWGKPDAVLCSVDLWGTALFLVEGSSTSFSPAPLCCPWHWVLRK